MMYHTAMFAIIHKKENKTGQFVGFRVRTPKSKF